MKNKKVKPDEHYYFATASKICSYRQTHHGKFIPMEFDKKSPEYQVIIEMIQKARAEVSDPIYIPARACKLYFAEYNEVHAPIDQPEPYPMVETEAGTQYAFDVPTNTQLALF